VKIVFVALGVYGEMGGIEQFNRRVARCLSELRAPLGLKSRIVALWDSVRDSVQAPEPAVFFGGNSRKARTACEFMRSVACLRPDIILYGHILLAPLAAAAKVLSARSRQILFVHGREVWREPFRKRVPVWERFAARWLIDGVVSVSQFTRKRMESAYALSSSRFQILPNAVDVTGEAKPAGAPRRNGVFRLLTVARLDRGARHKGCDQVIRAMPILLRSHAETHYYIAGRGPMRIEYERLAAELGVARNVHFLGYLDEGELGEAYRSSHVFVMPSSGEGFGIVFLEAWRHALPVVCGDRDASAEVIRHGFNGLCVNPHSPQEIASALATLANDQNAAARMGQAGHRTVAEQYSHTQFRERLAQILQRTG